jgi:hypothetical protein
MDQSHIDRQSFNPPEPSPWVPWLVGSAAAIAILLIALLVMKLAGLLDIPKSDTGAKTLAAALAIVGSIISAAVTLVGSVVKYSIDDRSARLAAVEAARNHALAVDAEKRNRIEAAIRAVDLLSENNKDSTVHKVSGALLALSSLGEHDLAVALLNELWSSKLASAGAAEIVLRRALDDGSEYTQISAADVLYRHNDLIKQGDHYIWPGSPARWRTDLPWDCRGALVLAAVGWMKAELAEDKNHLPVSSVVLYHALNDPDDVVMQIAVGSLTPLIRAFRRFPDAARSTGDSSVSIGQIAERVGSLSRELTSVKAIQTQSEIKAVLSKTRQRVSKRSSAAAIDPA